MQLKELTELTILNFTNFPDTQFAFPKLQKLVLQNGINDNFERLIASVSHTLTYLKLQSVAIPFEAPERPFVVTNVSMTAMKIMCRVFGESYQSMDPTLRD